MLQSVSAPRRSAHGAYGQNWEECIGSLINCCFTYPYNNWPNLPQKFVDQQGRPLGQWLARQRYFQQIRILPLSRGLRLMQLPRWQWCVQEAFWLEMFEALMEARDKHRHWPNVPYSFVDENGRKLGAWVKRLRRSYKSKELSAIQISRLESLPGWRWVLPQGNRPRG